MRPVTILAAGALVAGCTTAPTPKPPLLVFTTPAPTASPPTRLPTPAPKVTATKAPKPKATTAAKPKPTKAKVTPSSLPASAVRTFSDLPRAWQRVAMCESSGDLRQVTGSHYGLFQIKRGWWTGAHLDYRTATLAQQYALALHVWHRQGWAAWTCAGMLGIS